MVWRLRYLDGTGGTTQEDLRVIQNWLALQGINADVLKFHKPMRLIVNSAMKIHPPKGKAKRAFTWWELKKIFSLLPTDSINPIVFRAVIAFALATAMRSEEFLASKVRDDPLSKKQHYIRRDRVLIWEPKSGSSRKHFGIVWFFKSKTNQIKHKEYATIPCGCDKGLCPVVELKRLIDILVDPKPETVLFTWADGSFVTSNNLNTILKSLAHEIGSDAGEIGTYSLKKAAITQAIRDGIPDSVIVQLARWKNFESVRPYINLNPRQLIDARDRPYDGVKAGFLSMKLGKRNIFKD